MDLRKNSRIKFEDFLDEFYKLYSLNLKSCSKTHATYAKHFKEYFKGKHLNEIKVVDIERYKLERIKELEVATVNRYLSFLRCVFNKAIAWERFHGFNPVSKVKLYKENNARLRYLEKDEIIKLLSNCSGQLQSTVGLALNTGMRRDDIFSLKWADVNFNVRIIYLRLPIRKSFWTALKKSDIKDFHFHDLRHTFASQLVMSGVDLNTVRELLGHRSLEMTLRYAHLSPGHKRRAVDILDQNINQNRVKSQHHLVPIWSPEGHLSKDQKAIDSQVFELQEVA